MKSCAFFGHRDQNYRDQEPRIRKMVVYLIEAYGVTQFYAGGRGRFDHTCARIVHDLKENYPQIKLTQVFSYIPKEKNGHTSSYFDDSVYLLERRVPNRYAIIETNKALVDKVDFVISGVDHDWGGAAKAVEYAYHHRKAVFEVYAPTNGERRWKELIHLADRPLTIKEKEIGERIVADVVETIKKSEEKDQKSKKCKKTWFSRKIFKNSASKA